MIKAVILDFDDTLCPTEAACFDLENETLRRIGRPPMSREIHKKTWGMSFAKAIALRSPGVDVEKFMKVSDSVLAEFLKDGLIDVVPEANYLALDQLIESGMQVIILTSRAHWEIKHLLDPNHRLASRVKAFYYKDIMQHHKPDPRAFDVLLQEHNLSPQECVYVGDSVSDGIAAKGANLHFIASLESGIRQKQDFKDVTVDAFIDNFTDLTKAVDFLAKRQ
ncbi:MAG TPA: HAD family hydrolase [Patescibacteria group bacterium]|nr:HAD family hydrolase [Patescibacteria group bacterium]